MAVPGARQRRRQAWVSVHRWLGLGLLAFCVVIGLTGSALVFYREMLMALHPVVGAPMDPSQGMALDRIHQSLRQAHPDRQGAWRLELPMKPGEAVVARYMRPAESADRAFAPLMVWIDPASARIGHEVIWGEEPLTWLYDLHYSLLLDLDGRQAVGVLGALMTVSLLTGLVLWWPRPGGWRSALRLKRDAAAERRVYDWHKLTGVGSATWLLLLSLTGMALTWQQPATRLLQRVGPVFKPPPVVVQGPPVLSLTQAISLGRQRFPHAQLRWVETAPLDGGFIRLQWWQAGEPSRRFPRTQVWVDAASGEVVGVRDGLRDSVADTILACLHPLHNGELAAWPGRLLVLVSGLAPAVLALTGCVRWRHKARAKARAKVLAEERCLLPHHAPQMRGERDSLPHP